jgi:hypothetical protein
MNMTDKSRATALCICALASLVMLTLARPALAEARMAGSRPPDGPRIALVVGNGEYEAITSLANPVSDANLMAAALEETGFEVTLLINADQNAMKRGIADFGRKLRSSGPDSTGLFYYAGHGVQSQGSNYLLPVDGNIQDEADLDLAGVEADWVLKQLFSARNRTNIVILDACRNNPFAALGGGMGDQGLAEMKAPTGTFISYAAGPGDVALDGTDGNSPFTRAIAAGVNVEGAPIEQVFKQVRVDVLKETSGMQTPWDSSSLTGDFFFKAAEPMSEDELAARQLWDSVRLTADPVQVMLFLRAYPNSAHGADARALLKKAMAKELEVAEARVAVAPAPDPAPVAEGPSPREIELIEKAQISGTLEAYEAYSAEFPDGGFASLAVAEIDALKKKAAKALTAAAPAPAAPDPAPVVEGPSPREIELIQKAQISGTLEAYEAYSAEFPDGVFASLAVAEIDALKKKAATTVTAAAPAPAAPEPPQETQVAAAVPLPGADGETITFLTPLTRGAKPVAGRTIAEIIEGSPLYPPVEGLPESYWKDQKCSNCHKWTQARLCEQGNTYLSLKGQIALGKDHPLGGSFKQTLREWAASGCK